MKELIKCVAEAINKPKGESDNTSRYKETGRVNGSSCIWVKLFDKEAESEVPVFIDTREVVNTTTLKDGSMLVTVKGKEDGKVLAKTFVLKTKSMFFSTGEDMSSIPTSWKNKAEGQPSLQYDGWLCTDNID